MTNKYLTVTNTIKSVNSIDLIDDFVKAEGDKYIKIENVKVFNNNGQIDVGMFLCGTFADESIESCGLMDDFIASTYNTNDKIIHISNNNRRIQFYFRDYKGQMIGDVGNMSGSEKTEYYYLIELLLVWSTEKIINVLADK